MSIDIVQRAAAITELQSLLLSTQTIDDLLQGVASDASRRLAPHAEATVTLRRGGQLSGVAGSGDRARACDEAEYAAGAGPCVDAVDTGRIVEVPDVASEDRWPAWGEAARTAAFRSAIAYPAEVEPDVWVAVNIYSDDSPTWLAPSHERGTMYAAEVARITGLALRLAREAQISEDLRAALASRALIDQAIGVVMAQNRCTSAQALAILRSASQHRNVKVRDVAASMIESVSGHAPIPTTEFVPRSLHPSHPERTGAQRRV